MTDEINYLTTHPVILIHKVSPTCFPLYFASGFNMELFLGALAAQVVVVYQVDCSSGQRSLIGLRFVGCPASSGMEMHE